MQDVQDFISSQTQHSHLIYSLRSAFPRFARILVAPLETTSSTSKLRSYRKYQGRDLLNAIEEVRAGNMTAHTASRKYGVPSRTVYDKVKKIRDGLEVYIAK